MKEVTIYVTSGGKKFTDRQDAAKHELRETLFKIFEGFKPAAALDRFIDQLLIDDTKRSLLKAAIDTYEDGRADFDNE